MSDVRDMRFEVRVLRFGIWDSGYEIWDLCNLWEKNIKSVRKFLKNMKNIVIIGCGSGIGLATAQELQHSHHVLGISKSKTSELEKLNIQYCPK